jgi:hypothetical protein
MLQSVALALLSTLSVAAGGAAQDGPDGPPAATWTFDVTTFAYFLPDEPDYLQPTVTANRGSLHLESRYAYEDRNTFSLFAGWNATLGNAPRLEVTPMIGLVAGRTNGIAPGLELTLSWGPVELYSESEYVQAFGGAGSSFFYAWSELGLRPVAWLRAGLAAQRTRRFHSPREVSFGPMLGVTVGKLEATGYVLDRGSARRSAMLSVRLSL